MALLTDFPLEDAKRILEGYGLELLGVEALSAGSVNSNFFLRVAHASGERSYFARIYEEQGEVGARLELQLNEALFQAGIPVARPVRLQNGDLHSFHAGKPFAVYERLKGEVLCQSRVNAKVARSVGVALARVHTAPLGELKIGPSRFGFDGIEARLARVEASGRTDLGPAVLRLRELCARLRVERPTGLPEGLVHGDLFRDNVLVADDEVVGLLDFESASHGPYVFDLMVTLLAWCFGSGLDQQLARAMFEGYSSVRPMSADERAAMTIEGSVACARFASTRLTDFSLRVSEGQKPVRDYRRFFERLDALRGGELEQALASHP